MTNVKTLIDLTNFEIEELKKEIKKDAEYIRERAESIIENIEENADSINSLGEFQGNAPATDAKIRVLKEKISFLNKLKVVNDSLSK